MQSAAKSITSLSPLPQRLRVPVRAPRLHVTPKVKKNSSTPRLDTVIETCQEFKEALGGSMGHYMASFRHKRKMLARAHRFAQRSQVPWRHQSQYSAKRDHIRSALTDRHASVQEKESLLLQQLLGATKTIREPTDPAEAFSYKDLLSARMTKLLSWNKRDFGQAFSTTSLKFAEKLPGEDRKIHRFKVASDDVMLKREIIRFRRQDLQALSRAIPPPAVPVDREKRPESHIGEAQFLALSPLNQFILRQRQKFQPKSYPRHKHPRSQSP